jgi:hypothetical protein
VIERRYKGLEKNFFDVKVGDVVVAYDTLSHDYTPWTIKVTSIEYDDDFITDTNPKGKHCYGDCLELERGLCDENGDYITHVTEENFSRVVKVA